MTNGKLSGVLFHGDGARLVETLECVTSVLLAIVFAHAIGATNISWAAFAGYMVMRGHIADTLARGALRIAGTVTGGLAALLVTAQLAPHWPIAALALMIVGTGSLYAAITARRAYGWLFFGLTFAMVVFDKIEHPDIALSAFVTTRILETLAGTVACATVSLFSSITLRRKWPANRAAAAQRAAWHPDALRHAAQGGVALAVLTALSGLFRVPALAQAAVTIMAVMLVPVAGIGPGGFRAVSVRVLQRFIGCIAGAILAACFLVIAQGSPVVLVIGTVVGVFIGRQLENGGHAYRYFGMQFALAILTALVPDTYTNAAIAPALERLSGILIGMAVLEPVLIGWHVLRPSRAPTDPGPPSAAPDEV